MGKEQRALRLPTSSVDLMVPSVERIRGMSMPRGMWRLVKDARGGHSGHL